METRLLILDAATFARISYALSEANDSRESENGMTRDADLIASNLSAIAANNKAQDEMTRAWNAAPVVAPDSLALPVSREAASQIGRALSGFLQASPPDFPRVYSPPSAPYVEGFKLPAVSESDRQTLRAVYRDLAAMLRGARIETLANLPGAIALD